MKEKKYKLQSSTGKEKLQSQVHMKSGTKFQWVLICSSEGMKLKTGIDLFLHKAAELYKLKKITPFKLLRIFETHPEIFE